jgi:hypothetical protein
MNRDRTAARVTIAGPTVKEELIDDREAGPRSQGPPGDAVDCLVRAHVSRPTAGSYSLNQNPDKYKNIHH